jgi:carbohydrate diacid regulator
VQTKTPLIITNAEVDKYRGVKTGINLPIFNQDKIIGVVGISGVPEEVQEFGSLVVLMTELLIKQQLLSNEVEWKFRTRESIMDEILSEKQNHLKINQKLSVLNISLSPPYFPIVISLTQGRYNTLTLISNIYKDIESILDLYSCIYAFNDYETFLIVLGSKSVNEKDRLMDQLERFMLSRFNKVSISSGYIAEQFDQVRDSFKQLKLALQLSAERRIHLRDYEIQLILKELNEEERKRVKNRIQQQLTPELKETLKEFFNNDLNVQTTADVLFIHRNTLLYRLKKVHEITGYNPRKFHDAIVLQMSEWL